MRTVISSFNMTSTQVSAFSKKERKLVHKGISFFPASPVAPRPQVRGGLGRGRRETVDNSPFVPQEVQSAGEKTKGLQLCGGGLLFSLGVGEKAKETFELRPEGNQSAMQMPGEEY